MSEVAYNKAIGGDGKFEPEAKDVTTCLSDAALVSIAVSLKRIADALLKEADQ